MYIIIMRLTLKIQFYVQNTGISVLQRLCKSICVHIRKENNLGRWYLTHNNGGNGRF